MEKNKGMKIVIWVLIAGMVFTVFATLIMAMM